MPIRWALSTAEQRYQPMSDLLNDRLWNPIKVFIDLMSHVEAKPIDHLKEKQLQNDPAVKLKKAILSANSEQLQKVDQQVKQSLKQQVEDDIEY